MNKLYFLTIIVVVASSCSRKQSSGSPQKEKEIIGSIEALDSALWDYIDHYSQIEIIAEGFEWAEGPLWLAGEEMLLFSDVPENKVYQWSEASGLKTYLQPSGYIGDKERGGEPGSNGLILDGEGRLVLCQHGDRRMARMTTAVSNPKPEFITLADHYDGKKFNSPNDAVYSRNGQLYFTDPPYGLEGGMDNPAKEIPYQGVYRRDLNGIVHLITDTLTRPNGIAFSPDQKTLYVTNSDPSWPVLMAYEVVENGNITNGKVFFDTSELRNSNKGVPDGLKVNKAGIVFMTGPGGVLVIDKAGKHLGTIKTLQATSNCAFNEKEDILFITADSYVMRLPLKLNKE